MSDPFERPARPWDLFNKNLEHVSDVTSKERLAICADCPFYIKATTQCKLCGCFMKLKTKLPNAACPDHRWGQVNVPIDESM